MDQHLWSVILLVPLSQCSRKDAQLTLDTALCISLRAHPLWVSSSHANVWGGPGDLQRPVFVLWSYASLKISDACFRYSRFMALPRNTCDRHHQRITIADPKYEFRIPFHRALWGSRFQLFSVDTQTRTWANRSTLAQVIIEGVTSISLEQGI